MGGHEVAVAQLQVIVEPYRFAVSSSAFSTSKKPSAERFDTASSACRSRASKAALTRSAAPRVGLERGQGVYLAMGEAEIP